MARKCACSYVCLCTPCCGIRLLWWTWTMNKTCTMNRCTTVPSYMHMKKKKQKTRIHCATLVSSVDRFTYGVLLMGMWPCVSRCGTGHCCSTRCGAIHMQNHLSMYCTNTYERWFQFSSGKCSNTSRKYSEYSSWFPNTYDVGGMTLEWINVCALSHSIWLSFP